MWQDPVVQETRKLRKHYAAQFKHDPDAIFEDIRNRQKNQGKSVWHFQRVDRKLKQNITLTLIMPPMSKCRNRKGLALLD